MLILLEGVDCGGKSTLANTLARLLVEAGEQEPTMLHRGVPQMHPLDEYERCLDWYRPGNGDNVICDRWHIGADVYGPLMRGDQGLDPVVRWHVEAYLKSRGAILVLVEPPSVEEMLARMHRRGEDYINDEQAIHCFEAFRPVVQGSKIFKFKYTSDDDPTLLIDLAGVAEDASHKFINFPSYIGPVWPRVLLLGDKRNTVGGPEDSEAAFIPWPGTSGRYLLEALGDVDDVGIANANETTNLSGLYRRCGCPEVVALGLNAAKACMVAGIPHKVVKHPQYMRRFKHSDIETYGKDIRC